MEGRKKRKARSDGDEEEENAIEGKEEAVRERWE
jgi:hypothetical protein